MLKNSLENNGWKRGCMEAVDNWRRRGPPSLQPPLPWGRIRPADNRRSPPLDPPPCSLFEPNSASVPRGSKLQQFRPAFAGDPWGAIGGGGGGAANPPAPSSLPDPPPPFPPPLLLFRCVIRPRDLQCHSLQNCSGWPSVAKFLPHLWRKFPSGPLGQRLWEDRPQKSRFPERFRALIPKMGCFGENGGEWGKVSELLDARWEKNWEFGAEKVKNNMVLIGDKARGGGVRW